MNSGGPTVVHSGQGPWGFPPGGSGNGSGRPPPGGGGPWGGGGGPGGPRPGGPGGRGPGGPSPIPDIDALIASLQAAIRRFLGGGGGPRMRFTGGRPLLLLGLVIVVLWLGSSFYRVEPDELGIVMRFGAYSYRTEPGLHWHLPWPIEKVLLPAVTRINRTEIGYRSAGQQPDTADQTGRDVPTESLMLTGDENIIDINLTVFWKINNAQDYLFNTRDPDNLVKAVAESSIREVIGRTPIQPALTQLRAQIETDVHNQTQQILDRYKAGIDITQVQLQRVDPPDAVIESFRDVQRANTDAERMRNEAEAYHNDIVPRARGDAARVVAEGQGAKQAAVALATGQAQQFDAVLKAYQAAKDVTLQRMYLDTMQDILAHSQPLVVDDKLKGLVPFLPINPPPPARPAATAAAPSTAAAPGASQGAPR
ncbi:MAG TPA: FtsH protease activity modulator HflK [Acetobacteraceae bacterium]|jgi:modulator of FtsH protease HflK|nr:FtsH protease activity modulator HflK [Acetobacteraceae bacterium]